MRRFFAPNESIASGSITLDADETRHLRDVLRLKTGDEVSVFDGTGGEFRCEIRSISKRSAELALLDRVEPSAPESSLDLSLAAAIINGDKYDLVIQKSVELGVTRFIPLNTARCDVKLKDAPKRVERWERIALEATKQCGRATVMRIEAPVGFNYLISNSDPASTLLFSEREGETLPTGAGFSKITAVIGPKGGWDDDELRAAAEAAFKIVTLGGRILRAETAAISIAAVLQHRFGDLK
ncbi:MAG: 16S rRNA (uracil(1498)-N(3))-methyltransferase [Pyrinomonadaceae bacterium]